MGASRKIVLTAECICDIPEPILRDAHVNIIHYKIGIGEYEYQTETEINTGNILEYMERLDKKVTAYGPTVEEYRSFFAENIEEGKPLLHLALNSQAGICYENALKAAKDFPQVTVFDTRQISGGMGLLVLMAVEAADCGEDIEAILRRLNLLQKRMNTSFLITRGDYVCERWKVNRGIAKLVEHFKGYLGIRLEKGEVKAPCYSVRFGNLQECYRSYIRSALKRARPDKKILLVTHTGCTYEQQEEILKEIEKYWHFEKIIVNTASAVVTCNCGGKSIGLQFLNET